MVRFQVARSRRSLSSRSWWLAPAMAAFAVALSAPAGLAQDDDDDDILTDDDEAPIAAPAEERKKVGLVGFVPVGTAGKPLAEQVTSSLSKEFAESSVVEMVSLAVGSSDDAKPVDMAMGQDAATAGDKSRKKGERYLKKLSFSKARRSFKKALDSYTQAGAALTDVSPVIDVHLGIAESYARQGKEEEAEEALASAARLNPEYVLDDKRFPPLFIRTHGKVRDRVLKEASGVIEVDGTAVGAEVRIDGRVVGTAPIRVSNVPPGAHFIRVYKEKEGLFGSVVELSEGGSENVSPGFVELGATGPLDQLASNTFTSDAARNIAAQARKENLAAAVLGVVGKTRSEVPTALLIVDATSAQVLRIPVMRFDGDLLNMAIESLKGREAIENAITTGGYGAVDEEALVEGVEVGREAKTQEVALRYDVKAPAKTTRRSTRSRLVTGVDDDGEDGEGGGRLITSGRKKARSLKGDSKEKSTFGEKKRFNDEALDDDDGLLTQPWFWGSIAAGGAVAVAAAGGAAFGAYYFLSDPAGVRFNVVQPNAAQ